MYLNCILNLFVKTFLNEIKESITLSCLCLMVCIALIDLILTWRLEPGKKVTAEGYLWGWVTNTIAFHSVNSFVFKCCYWGTRQKAAVLLSCIPAENALFSLWNSPVSLSRCGSVTGDDACRWQTVGVWTTLTVVSFSPHRLCLFRKLIQ